MLMGCYAMFGLSLLASSVVITLIWRRLAAHGAGPAAMVPTLWIVLGPVGSVDHRGEPAGCSGARGCLPRRTAAALHTFGVVYGIPVLGLAALWSIRAASITVRTARDGLPFSLTWWSFTFPVGTCVTGATALAVATGSECPGGGSGAALRLSADRLVGRSPPEPPTAASGAGCSSAFPFAESCGPRPSRQRSHRAATVVITRSSTLGAKPETCPPGNRCSTAPDRSRLRENGAKGSCSPA